MYESLLRRTRIHRLQDGRWGFHPPTSDVDGGVQAVWWAIDDLLRGRDGRRLPVSELYAHLKAPPYGVVDGPLPVFLTAYLCAHRGDVALYEQGSFIPQIDLALLERLIKDPKSFEVQFCKIGGVRLTMLGRLIGALDRPAAENLEAAQLVDVVRQLSLFVTRLPAYARRTRRLDAPALNLRQALLQARDPYQLIFGDIPKAFELPPFTGDDEDTRGRLNVLSDRLKEAVAALQSAYPELLREIERLLATAFALVGEGPAIREALATRAGVLSEFCLETRLKAFVLRVSDTTHSQEAWLESVATLLTQKPPKDWADTDLARFEVTLSDIRRSFLHLERLAVEEHRRRGMKDGAEVVRLGVTTLAAQDRERVLIVSPTQRATLDDLQNRLAAVLPQDDNLLDLALAALAKLAGDLMDRKQ
jgi:hypothetical protein